MVIHVGTGSNFNYCHHQANNSNHIIFDVKDILYSDRTSIQRYTAREWDVIELHYALYKSSSGSNLIT